MKRPKLRNWLQIRAWQRGHAVEQSKKKYTRKQKHKGQGNE